MSENKKSTYSNQTKWEDFVGYTRAVRIGRTVEVSGTIAIDDEGNAVGINNAYEQTVFIIRKAEKAIQALGGSLSDVIRTRIYTTDISLWEEIGKAHGEFFCTIKPASTMVEISRLIMPENLVEIEFTAQIQ
ncbi:MAG: RidA family protein [bacterium]